MNLDVPGTPLSVDPAEVEPACLALQGPAVRERVVDPCLPKSRIPARGRDASERAPGPPR